MKIISFKDIKNLKISPSQMYQWVEMMLLQKKMAMLPPKTSITQAEHCFYNVMPCVLPEDDIMGVKIVTRYPSREPSLLSQILLYRQSTGEMLALMDGTYITALRTGAVAAHSIITFSKKDFDTIGFIGLGNSARATMYIFASLNRSSKYHVKLLRYKDQTENFINRFQENKNIVFTVCERIDEVISQSDTTVSCVTYTDELFAEDYCYQPGCTIIPVHTRGFQNCDLFFDKVFADDRNHIQGFKYFNNFKSFAETCDVVTGKCAGRISNNERVIVYNIGISIHDIYFAYKVYMLLNALPNNINFSIGNVGKFWL